MDDTAAGVKGGISAIEVTLFFTAFIAAGNEKPKPHKWVKSVGESLAAVELFCQNSVANLCG